VAKEKSLVTDVQALRRRARAHMEDLRTLLESLGNDEHEKADQRR
jgi:hypothetical protein